MWKTKWGSCIYTSPSGYKVYQNFMYRWLTLGSPSLQTLINRYTPARSGLWYLPAFTLMARSFPGPSCLLGLGGAGVAHLLRSKTPGQEVLAIDNNQEVIDIAKKYFMVEKIPNLAILHQNAVDYISQSNKQYHHMLIDLYNAHNFPEECNNEDFFIHCKNRLVHNGYMVVNLANYKEQLPILKLIKKQFKSTIVIPIKKSANIVIIASPEETNEVLLQKIQNTKEIKKIVWTEEWNWVGMY